jgi:hypothetical protein
MRGKDSLSFFRNSGTTEFEMGMSSRFRSCCALVPSHTSRTELHKHTPVVH